jgi:hypothetical protein
MATSSAAFDGGAYSLRGEERAATPVDMMPDLWRAPSGSMSVATKFRRAPCRVPECTREWAVRPYRFEHLMSTGWPTQPMVVVNWCGHGQEFVPRPEKDSYWVLVPVVETVAT